MEGMVCLDGYLPLVSMSLSSKVSLAHRSRVRTGKYILVNLRASKTNEEFLGKLVRNWLAC